MEVKPGYKKTEIGVIPEEWKVKPLGEIATVTAGGTPSRANPKYWDGDVPWVTTSEVDFCTISHAEQLITKEGLNNSAAKLLPRGTLLMALYGQGKTRGKVGILGIDAATNQACAAISLKNSASHEFIFYFLASQYDIIRKMSNTGNQENLNGALVRSILILLPPLPEQRAIAEALCDVDGLLGGLDRLIAKKRDLKQAAMEQLLTGQTRLPGFHGEWENMCLGDLFTFKNGLNKGKEFFGFGTPIVNYMDVFANPGIYCSMLEGRVSLTREEINNFDVRRGDVLFTRTSETPEEVGMSSVILDEPDQTVFSGFVLRGRPKNERLCNAFKAYCFRSPFVRNQITSKASYTTRALTNGRILSAVVLSVPAFPEQAAIAAVLTDMDAEITTLEQRREKTRALKQAMMQELLTGKTRLVAAGGAYA
jgi:type I restriction enzyme S subunit